jgi:mersacidin/lichenicidin family type 2 lantibiotic
MAKVDIARALKDQEYFNSLTEEEKAQVRAASGVGGSEISDDDLDSVSGGAGGAGVSLLDTTTTTDDKCSCPGDGCVCSCDDDKIALEQ